MSGETSSVSSSETSLPLDVAARVRKGFQSFVLGLGDFSLFVVRVFQSFPHLWRRRGIFLNQCEFIGVTSLGVATVAALFMGAVMGYQLYLSFHMFGAEGLLGGSVGVSLFREIGPVIGAIMVTGRAGAAIAAEIATMRVSEQIDALEVMAVDPIEFLVGPRVLAGLVMMPLVTLFFAAIATLSASGIACGVMDLTWVQFWRRFAYSVDRIDMVHCVLKGATFGLALTLVSCYFGFKTHGGARAVGLATRSTVVVSCLSILLCDYVLTSILPFGFENLKMN